MDKKWLKDMLPALERATRFHYRDAITAEAYNKIVSLCDFTPGADNTLSPTYAAEKERIRWLILVKWARTRPYEIGREQKFIRTLIKDPDIGPVIKTENPFPQ